MVLWFLLAAVRVQTASVAAKPVGPRVVPVPNGGPNINFAPGQPILTVVWVTNDRHFIQSSGGFPNGQFRRSDR
jgi:hypothetical protein